MDLWNMAPCKIPPKICYSVVIKQRCFKPENILWCVRNLHTPLRDFTYTVDHREYALQGRTPCSSVPLNCMYP